MATKVKEPDDKSRTAALKAEVARDRKAILKANPEPSSKVKKASRGGR